MIICGVDLETTGLDPNKDQVTEIGAVLWDTELNAPIRFFNKLIKIQGNVPPEIVRLTGITDELLREYGEDPKNVWDEFWLFTQPAKFFLAHNAPFDKGFIAATKRRIEDSAGWIDSSVDVEYPEHISTRKLTHLAAEHGFVNPFAHRAVTDVLTMCQIVSQYDWNEVIKSAQTPSVKLRAMVGFNDNQKAKNVGFRWDATNKVWIKNVKEHKVDQEITKCRDLGFLVKRVG